MLLSLQYLYILSGLFIYEVFSEAALNAIPCSVRKDISPCTCENHVTTEGTAKTWITVSCQKMNSFAQIINVLQNKFENKNAEIHLNIEYSNLEDMSKNKFSEIKSPISWIKLQNNIMTELPNSTFEGISTVTHLYLDNSKINQFPGTIFEHLPNVQFLTISRTSIKTISPADFKSLKKLRNLVIQECNLSTIENGTFPKTLQGITLSENNITTLNHTLRDNFNLRWAWIHHNNIHTLKEQMPDHKPNHELQMLDVSYNQLTSLPESFTNLKKLNSFSAVDNRISDLNTVFTKLNNVVEIDLANNQIKELSPREFEGCAKMIKLNLSNNEIWNLNRSLVPLVSLEYLNLTNNKLTEFSLEEIQGLEHLIVVELSHNKIAKFIGKVKTDTTPTNISITELRLEFNDLHDLEGSIGEIQGLINLNLSYNRLENIPAEFLSGLNQLQHLDVAHNLLHTLEDISKAVLPSLGYFYAAHNRITELNDIFSAVCFLHLEFNKIETIKPDFGDNNPCVYRPGTNATLYIYLDGNEILCKEITKKNITEVESKNNTKIMGQCPKMPNEELKYNVNNTDSSPITLVTLGEYVN